MPTLTLPALTAANAEFVLDAHTAGKMAAIMGYTGSLAELSGLATVLVADVFPEVEDAFAAGLAGVQAFKMSGWDGSVHHRPAVLGLYSSTNGIGWECEVMLPAVNWRRASAMFAAFADQARVHPTDVAGEKLMLFAAASRRLFQLNLDLGDLNDR